MPNESSVVFRVHESAELRHNALEFFVSFQIRGNFVDFFLLLFLFCIFSINFTDTFFFEHFARFLIPVVLFPCFRVSFCLAGISF